MKQAYDQIKYFCNFNAKTSTEPNRLLQTLALYLILLQETIRISGMTERVYVLATFNSKSDDRN